MASISFNGDSSEAFANTLQHFAGWTVAVIPEDGEPFDAELIGSAADNDELHDFFAVRVRAWDDNRGEGTGEPFDVVVRELKVY